MLRSLVLAAALVPLTAAGCASSSPADPAGASAEAGPDGPVTVTLPEPVPMTEGVDADGDIVAGHGMEVVERIGLNETVQMHGQPVTFLSVVEDSRCPEGTTCVWEGRARVTVRVSDQTVTLATPSSRTEPLEPIDGVEVELIGLYPYPGSAEAEAGAPIEIGVTAREAGK